MLIAVHGLHAEVRHRAQPRHISQERDERQGKSDRAGRKTFLPFYLDRKNYTNPYLK